MTSIYKIYSTKGDKVYIGSSLDVRKRFYDHKSKKHSCTSSILFEEYGADDCEVVILEVCGLEDRFQRERHWLDQHPTAVNKRKPFESVEEYRARRAAISRRQDEINRKRREKRKKQSLIDGNQSVESDGHPMSP